MSVSYVVVARVPGDARHASGGQSQRRGSDRYGCLGYLDACTACVITELLSRCIFVQFYSVVIHQRRVEMAILHSIPVIDISPFLDPTCTESQKNEIVVAVRDACVTYGFFQLIGHGVPPETQEQILGCAKSFFDLPLAEKQALAMSKAMGESNRGYETIGGQRLQSGKLPDLKEVSHHIVPPNDTFISECETLMSF